MLKKSQFHKIFYGLGVSPNEALLLLYYYGIWLRKLFAWEMTKKTLKNHLHSPFIFDGSFFPRLNQKNRV